MTWEPYPIRRLRLVAFDYELVGMKTAQGMLELLADKPMQSNKDLPLLFIERESVRRLGEPLFLR